MLDSNRLVEYLPRLTPEWVAGFIDGEGCICAVKRKRSSFGVELSIAQKEPSILFLLSMKFPDSSAPSVFHNSISGAKCWQLHWSGSNCLEILRYVENHVVLKKKQVELGLRLARFHLRRPEFSRVSDGEKVERRELALAIKSLNEGKTGAPWYNVEEP